MSSVYNRRMNKQEFQEKYGMELKIARLRCKLTQEQLAEKVNCTSVYIGYIERGLQCPTLYQFVKIANVLNLDLNKFFEDFEE